MSSRSNRKAQPQPSAKQAIQQRLAETARPPRAETEVEGEKLSYDERLAQMSASERINYKLSNNLSRVGNVLDVIRSWTVTDEAAKKHVEEAIDCLLEAQDGIRSASAAIKALGNEFKPVKVRKTSKVEVGSIVKIGKRDREAFTELMPGVNLDRLEVVAVRGNRLRVKLSDGTTGFCNRSQVAVSDDPKEEAA